MKILVLKGGISNEREVSLKSGKGVADAANEEGYDVFEYDFTGDVEDLVSTIKNKRPDVVFNALHGQYGEDGRVQGLLDLMKVKYTHSGYLASAICMNKSVTNALLEKNGVLVPKSVVSKDGFLSDPLPRPFVIKPVDDGSSVGVFVVNDGDDFPKIDYEHAMAEEYIPGKELTVTIFDGKAWIVTEIVSLDEGFYDYEHKYTDGKARHDLPANLPEDVTKGILETAQKAYNVLGCRGVARADFRYDGEDFYFLEMNTQPGMTSLSLSPEQAQYDGISYQKFVRKMIEAAV